MRVWFALINFDYQCKYMKHLRGIIHCIALWHIRTLILSEIKLNIL